MIRRTTIGSALVLAAILWPCANAHAISISMYNDCVFTSTGNVTNYSGYLGGGGGFEVTSGLLKDYSTGLSTGITATLSASNVSGSTGVMPAAGTPAHSAFNGSLNLGGSASYGDSTYDWWYQVTFSGLDPTKAYEFATTANRGSSYNPERWSKFSIIGADTYANASSAGTIEITPDVVHLNGGANSASGDIVQWTGITAADGSFTMKSESLRDINGKPYGYGMQVFRLIEREKDLGEIPEPSSVILIGLLLAGAGLMERRRRSCK